jgi:hypothetical protein
VTGLLLSTWGTLPAGHPCAGAACPRALQHAPAALSDLTEAAPTAPFVVLRATLSDAAWEALAQDPACFVLAHSTLQPENEISTPSGRVALWRWLEARGVTAQEFARAVGADASGVTRQRLALRLALWLRSAR